MKRILFVCLLGMGLLLPSTTITAKNFFVNHSTVNSISRPPVDIWIEDEALFVTSDTEDGTLVWVKIYNSAKVLVLAQFVSGYSDVVDVSSLSSGTYSATVHTTVTNYSENFTK